MAARLQDIAEDLNISISTVSLAFRDPARIADETRQRIYEAAERLGYVYRQRQPFQTELKTISFLMRYPPKGGFYSSILSGAEGECQRWGIALRYGLLEEVTPRSLKLYSEADGLLAVGNVEEQAILQLKELKRPMVLIDNNLPESGLDRVLIENTSSVARSVRYLAARGHRTIAFMRGIEWHPSFRERLAGYRQTMASLGLQPIELRCDEPPFAVVAEQSIERWLDQHGQPGFSAIIACNDDAAVGIINGLHARQLRVPANISVVGFDDNDVASLIRPALTTARVPRELLGALGVRRLVERANDPDSPTRAIVLDTQLVERDSVSPYRS